MNNTLYARLLHYIVFSYIKMMFKFNNNNIVLSLVVALFLRRRNYCDALSSSSVVNTPPPPTTTTAQSLTKNAVIVGGGPVGLATALTLSQPPHCYNVTILEKSVTRATFDPTRAYLYNVNPRGLQMFDNDKFSNALAKLVERGTAPRSGMGSICYIPADPSVPIPSSNPVTVSGTSEVPIKRRNYWIPRHVMVELLEECCTEQEQQRMKTKDGTLGCIQLLRKGFEDIIESDDNDELIVRCTDQSEYRASLVVAADGVNSSVRARLAAAADASSSPRSGWLQSQSKQFRVRKYISPASGLKMKSIQFPAGFKLTNTTGEKIPTESTSMYVFRGVNKGSKTEFSLGFLPVKDPNMIRPGNTNTRYDHEIWSITEGPKMKKFFEQNFPRVKWDDIVDDEEWDRYAKAKGTTFPPCQYSPGSAVVSPSKQVGVVMVGDSCHAFSPDIGQGINAGFQDVLALDRALCGQDIITGGEDSTAGDAEAEAGDDNNNKKPKLTLGDALEAYQRNRGPEHKALIQLARCGAPYQYRQTWIRDRIGRFLWTANVAFRMALNKLSGGLIPPGAIIIMQNNELTYRQVMRRANLTSRTIKLFVLAFGWLLWKRRVVA